VQSAAVVAFHVLSAAHRVADFPVEGVLFAASERVEIEECQSLRRVTDALP
jgi:hypothetical protein